MKTEENKRNYLVFCNNERHPNDLGYNTPKQLHSNENLTQVDRGYTNISAFLK